MSPSAGQQSSQSSQSNPISSEDRQRLMELADNNHDGELSDNEIEAMIVAYNSKQIADPKVLEVLSKYDMNKDGHIDLQESGEMKHQLGLQDTNARYAGYSLVAARAFRYLAFTSDFGEALRPVASARLVSGTYAIAFGYCFADVGYEAYKHVQRGYVTEKYERQSLSQVVIERATFQAVASLAIPALLIHTTVDVTKKICQRLNRFQKWGPSIAGLCFIPLLPMYLDHPVEHAIEWTFHHYGPWTKPQHTKSD